MQKGHQRFKGGEALTVARMRVFEAEAPPRSALVLSALLLPAAQEIRTVARCMLLEHWVLYLSLK